MKPRQQGIALVMVLWLLVLLTVIASSHSSNIRTETRLAFNHLEAARARHLAEAALNHAILEMLVTDHNQRWSSDGSVQHIRLDGGDAAISVRDVRGLVDINSAGATTFDPLLIAAGIENDRQRQSLIGAILDWRDKDQLKHLRGAEDAEYHRAGLQWAARDGAFTSVEEFRYILGMTNELYQKLEPYLTVNSGKPGINADFAPAWLAEAFGVERSRSSGSGASAGAPGGTSTYRITARATTTAGTTTSLSVEIKFEANKDKPYTILSWRTPAQATAIMEIPEQT